MTTAQIHPDLVFEIEKYKSIVKVGDVIHYVDASNCMTYEVTENFGEGIEVKALSDNCSVEKGKFEALYFDELQRGWCFSENSKNMKKEFYHA